MAEDVSSIVDDGLAAGSSCGSLYVVATPIGHLSDLGERASQVLRSVDVVAAEDTRTSRVLLDHVGSRARTIAAHRHNEREAGQRIIALLAQGRDVALVSDAGTPAISDPGARIVAAALRAGHRAIPVPGPSAPIALLSACGLVEGAFHFEGFLPARAKARETRLAALARMPHAFVLLEAPHRIAATLPALAAACGAARWIALGRELTKRFEEIHVCRAGDAPAWLAADSNRERGEYVLVVAAPSYEPEGAQATGAEGTARGVGAPGPGGADDDAPGAATGEAAGELAGGETVTVGVDRLLDALLDELPLSRAVRVAERATGLAHRAVYRRALDSAKRRERA